MTIRLLASELYRSKRAVDALEKELANSPVDQRARIKERLRKARAEMNYLRSALDGKIGR